MSSNSGDVSKITVDDSLRWIEKFDKLKGKPAKLIMIKHLISQAYLRGKEETDVSKIDGESQKFIQETLDSIQTWDDLWDLYTESKDEMDSWLVKISVEEWKKLAEEKMIKGALEHKAPDPLRDYDKELQDEYLDCILWLMMKRYFQYEKNKLK